MPDDSLGNFTNVPGYRAITGQKAQASQHTPPLEDIAQSLSARLMRDGRAPMTGPINMNGNRIYGLAAGVAGDDVATVSQANANGVQIGVIETFAGAKLPPGYLWANGAAVLRSEYPDLDAVIYRGDALNATSNFGYRCTSNTNPAGTRSPAGQYVVLPNLCELTVVGTANMGGVTPRGLLSNFTASLLGAVFGVQNHALTIAQMPAHDHSAQTGLNAETSVTYTNTRPSSAGGAPYGTAFGDSWIFRDVNRVADIPAHRHAIASQGGGGAHPNVQPTIVLNKIIKAKLI